MNWRPRLLESELFDGKEIEVVGLVEIREDQKVEVVGGRRAAGAWRDARRMRAEHAQTTLKAEPSGRTRLINVNARSNAHGSSLFVNMSPLWEDVSW